MVARQPAEARLRIHDRGGRWLLQVMRDGRRKFTERADSIHVGEVGLELAQSLALLFDLLAFRHVDNGTDVFDRIAVTGKRRVPNDLNMS